MARQQSREKEEFWRLVFQEFQDFEGTARAFCRREGLAVNSFYAWRKKTAERDGASSDASPAGFVPVKVVSGVSGNAPETTVGQIEIVTPSGFTLRCEDSIRASRLSELLGVMVLVDGQVRQC